MSLYGGRFSRSLAVFALVAGTGVPVTANFNIAAPDSAQEGLLFVVQASTSSRIGTLENPFTVGGGEQNIELTFVGENNSLDGQLLGSGLEFAARLEGDLNALTVDTNFNGLVASFLSLDVEGALNEFRLVQGEDDDIADRRTLSRRRRDVLELAELDLRYEVTGASNVLTIQPADGTRSRWVLDGVGNDYLDTVNDSLDIEDELFWRGSNGVFTREVFGSEGIQQSVAVVGDEHVLSLVYDEVVDSSVDVSVAGMRHVLTLALEAVVGATVVLDIGGLDNRVSARLANQTNPVLRLTLQGSSNIIDIVQIGP